MKNRTDAARRVGSPRGNCQESLVISYDEHGAQSAGKILADAKRVDAQARATVYGAKVLIAKLSAELGRCFTISVGKGARPNSLTVAVRIRPEVLLQARAPGLGGSNSKRKGR